VLADQNDEGQQSRALQIAEGNAKRYERSAEAVATFGYVLYRNRRVDDALKVLDAMIKGTGGQMSPDTAYYIALCLKDKDKADDAKKILKGASEAKGLFVYKKEAKDLLDKLERATAPPPKGPMSK
jgi:hypothetical protein